MSKFYYMVIMALITVCHAEQPEESFVVKKKNPKQSVSKLKELYASELGELIRMVPKMQKQLAEIQECLIDELSSLLENDLHISKIDLDARVKKSHELRSYMNQDMAILDSKTAFAKRSPCCK